MIVALTGATGFVGGHVLKRLIADGHQVRALARRPQGARDGVEWIMGALDDEASLARLCDSAQVVFHVAGVVNAADEAAFDAGNRVGTLAMLHAAGRVGIDRFVHVSTIAAREPKLSIYGATKRAGEDAVVVSALDWRIVRPPAVYGPGDKDMLDLFRFARKGLLPLPPKGRMSLIHVDDLARLIVALARDEAPSHARFEPDDGRPGGWTHHEFAQALGHAVGKRVVGLSAPKVFLSLAAKIDRMARGAGAKLTADRVGYMCHPDWTIDPSRAVPAELWSPHIPTERGLAETAAWYRTAGWL